MPQGPPFPPRLSSTLAHPATLYFYIEISSRRRELDIAVVFNVYILMQRRLNVNSLLRSARARTYSTPSTSSCTHIHMCGGRVCVGVIYKYIPRGTSLRLFHVLLAQLPTYKHEIISFHTTFHFLRKLHHSLRLKEKSNCPPDGATVNKISLESYFICIPFKTQLKIFYSSAVLAFAKLKIDLLRTILMKAKSHALNKTSKAANQVLWGQINIEGPGGLSNFKTEIKISRELL